MKNGTKQLEKDFRVMNNHKREGDIPLYRSMRVILSTDSELARADRSPVSKPLGLGHNGTAHDLAGHGSWDILHEVDLVGVSDGAQCLADMGGDLFRELWRLSNAIPEHEESDDLLTGKN
jgi:hypothetical protein